MSRTKSSVAADRPNEIATVRIELLHTRPLIWRQVEVPTSITLKVLHEIVQIAVGWFDTHMWEFTLGKRTFGLPADEDWGPDGRVEAAKVSLREVLRAKKTVIGYTYDFGDSWEHRLIVTEIRDGEPGVSYPRFVGGDWNGPPEDCGGIPGFYATLKVLANPRHPRHEEVTEWVGDFDPKEVGGPAIQQAFDHIAERGQAGKSSSKRKRAG